MTNKEIGIKYANDVLNNVIPACVEIKQASQRFLDNLSNSVYYYNDTDVDKVVEFINSLYLTEQKNPKHFILEPWQTFIICNLYGLKNKETDLRKYRFAYLELARKNGKSQLVIALAIYHLIFDTDAQVVVSANSLRQIKDVDFKKVKQFSDQLDKKQKHLVQYYNSIKYGSNELLVTATDASKLDGLNISFCLIDEFHEAKNNKLYNVFKSAMGNRDEPLFLIITTAGFDTESFCYSQRTYYKEILAGAKKDEEQFVMIYTIDSDDQISTGNTDIWLKANPNLGVSIKHSFLNSEVNKALNNEVEKPGVMVKNFNCWLKNNTLDIWLPESIIFNSMKEIKIEDLKGYEMWCGVDLASVSDIAAVSYMIQLDGNIHFFNEYYIPEYSMSTNINRNMYKEAGDLGYINITGGNVIDTDYILKDILDRHKNNFIRELHYDKWNSTQFAIDATEAGLLLKPFSQLPGNLNKPLKEFETLIKRGHIKIQNNSITTWMLGNVVLKINDMGNYKIDKSSKSKKIDGVAAMINALGGYLESQNVSFNVY